MIGPIGVNHAYFSQGWISVFALKVLLTEFYVSHIHGQAILLYDVFKRFIVK